MPGPYKTELWVKYELDSSNPAEYELVLQSMVGVKAKLLKMRITPITAFRSAEDKRNERIAKGKRFGPHMTQSQEGLAHSTGPWSERPDSKKVTAVAPDMPASRAQVTRKPKKAR